MNLIPESNGLKKVNMKEKLSTIEWIKRIAIVILAILVTGFIFQSISNFIGNEKVEPRLNYAKVDGKRLEYRTRGEGDYTIVFDGAIGANLYEWEEVSKKVEKELDVKTFVYNRNGYGFSGISTEKTPKEQADDLKILLRKAGVSGPIILVGEEYGSLVLTNFAKMYPENVKGMVLIKPINESVIKSKSFKKSIRWKYYKTKLEKTGSSFFLTSILDKLGVATTIDGFEVDLPRGADEEFAVHKTKKDYRQAVYNEVKNLYEYKDTSQVDGLIGENPLFIISNNPEEDLVKLGPEKYRNLYVTDSESKLLSITNSDDIVNGISHVIKEAKKIQRKSTK